MNELTANRTAHPLRGALWSSLLVAAAGCGGPYAGDIPLPFPTGQLRIVNNSQVSLTAAYVSSIGVAAWGSARNDTPIAPNGGTVTITLVPASYDALVTADVSSATYSAYKLGWTIGSQGTYDLVITDEDFGGNLALTNGHASSAITAVYITPVSNSSWGSNQATSGIAPGATTKYVLSPGYYDVRCDFANGVKKTDIVEISRFQTAAETCQGDYSTATFRVYNNTSRDISSVDLGLAGGGWLLGSYTVVPGDWTVWLVSAPGTHDYRAVITGTDSTYYDTWLSMYGAAGERIERTAYSWDFSGSFTLHNAYTYSITGFYASTTTYRGTNWLSSSVIPGATIHWINVTPRTYNVWCVYSNGVTATGTMTISSLTKTALTCY